MVRTGESLVSLRKSKRLSQRALAERVGVSQQSVAAWEHGIARPDDGHRAALAGALSVTQRRIDEVVETVAQGNEDLAEMRRVTKQLQAELGELRERAAVLDDLLRAEREKVDLLCGALPQEHQLAVELARISDRQVRQLQTPSASKF